MSTFRLVAILALYPASALAWEPTGPTRPQTPYEQMARSSSHARWIEGPEHRPPPDGYLFASAQLLDDSDHAFSVDAGVFSGGLGFTGSFTQFDDSHMQQPGERLLPRQLYSFAWAMRTTVLGRLELTGEVGLAGMHRIDEHLFGGVLGGTARIKLESPLALELSSHGYRFDADALALEGRIGIAAGPVRVSYRVIDLRDSRPPLHGPEAAVGFRF